MDGSGWEYLERCSEDYDKRIDKLNKQIECLQEQLTEANEVIENMKLCMDDKYDYDCVADDVDIYLRKWGVK